MDDKTLQATLEVAKRKAIANAPRHLNLRAVDGLKIAMVQLPKGFTVNWDRETNTLNVADVNWTSSDLLNSLTQMLTYIMLPAVLQT